MNKFSIFLCSTLLINCQSEKLKTNPSGSAGVGNDFEETFELYSDEEPEKMYSTRVLDTFKIFKALPKSYKKDTFKYPLILILDANAYFEPFVAEFKLGMLTQEFPESIIVGIGYKSFWTMDSLRNRDYTPLPDNEDPGTGGGEKFRNFIDQELLPKLKHDFKIDDKNITMMGHSLGGLFVLHYLFSSSENAEFKINNFISASPSLDWDKRYLFNVENRSSNLKRDFVFKLFLSMGSLDRDTTLQENVFLDFKKQMQSHHYKSSKIKFMELGNFEHMDAAIPGFIKGMIFLNEKN